MIAFMVPFDTAGRAVEAIPTFAAAFIGPAANHKPAPAGTHITWN